MFNISITKIILTSIVGLMILGPKNLLIFFNKSVNLYYKIKMFLLKNKKIFVGIKQTKIEKNSLKKTKK